MISLNSISKQDTLFLKGIAICGMLMWHIFHFPTPDGSIYGPMTRYFGAIGDVCVDVFLFISGYGLSIGFSKQIKDKESIVFVVKRLLKFYSNFWFVFIVIVLFGTIVMHQPLQTDGVFLHTLSSYVKEFFAIRGFSSYNDSWWYFSLIISIYLLFPILYWGVVKTPIFVVLFPFLMESLSVRIIGVNIQLYLPIFLVGMLWAIYGYRIPKLSVGGVSFTICFTVFVPLFVLFFDDERTLGPLIYGILTIGLAVLSIVIKNNIINRVFCYLGTYATNIYIIHLCFSKYWFPNFFYSLENPWIIFGAVLLSSLIFSITIEWIKDVTRYNDLFQKIINIIK